MPKQMCYKRSLMLHDSSKKSDRTRASDQALGPAADSDLENRVMSAASTVERLAARLRGPDGCPWDKEQTHLTLTRYALEETGELVEAIELGDDGKLREELGDVLFQVALHSQMAWERRAFHLADVMESLVEKMIRRHPHVFGAAGTQTTDEVLRNWETLKAAEKAGAPKKLLDVPVHLPALQRSAKIGHRTNTQKFDWSNAGEVLVKVREEMAELEEALESGVPKEIEHELGDVLFSLAQLGRHLNLDPEQVLRNANRRFENRYEEMHALATSRGLKWDELSLDQKEDLWVEAKERRRSQE